MKGGLSKKREVVGERHCFVSDYIHRNFSTDSRILELGPEKGDTLKKLFDFGFNNLDCADISNQLIFPEIRGLNRLQIVDLNYSDPQYPPESFDVILALQILEHLENPSRFMRQCRKLLKKSGLLLISLPNGHSFFSKIRFCLKGNVCRYEMGSPHITFLTRNIFKKIFLQDFTLKDEVYPQGTLGDIGYKLIHLPNIKFLNKLFGRYVYYFLEKK